MSVKAHILYGTELPSIDTLAYLELALSSCVKLSSVMETYPKFQVLDRRVCFTIQIRFHCTALLSGGAYCPRNKTFIKYTMESTVLKVHLSLLFEAVQPKHLKES